MAAKISPTLLLPEAERAARSACEQLARAFPDLHSLVPTGRLRRQCQTEYELTIVAQSSSPATWPRQQFLAPLNVRLVICDPGHFGIALLFTTGSRKHLERLQELAWTKGLKLTEQGLWRGSEEIICREEQDIYRALGLPYIEPELREDGEEVGLGLQGRLPGIINAQQIRGILHNHTVFSDGRNTLEEMAAEARARGYEYFGVGDHFEGAAGPSSMTLERAAVQIQAIDALNSAAVGGDIRILKGLEVDINRDGSLKAPSALLPRLDYLVCSVHNDFRLSREEQTARLIRAARNPHTTMLAHLTGRLLPEQEAYDVELDSVLRACASFGVVVEINANPRRLDLDWRWHQRAVDMGCRLCINPDAHSIQDLDHMRWGIAAARKGGLSPASVLNCANREQIADYFASRRSRALKEY